ncbi:class I SAM-dependent methyltransferase [Bacillus massiliigorillae]|uniref:class I SAM-dependent methyltransferase n=1 Tax=Bacillus massiliigorillae TaxID=1243664 RepID=UPI00039F7989|nr:class I SAM-dependent methyltransferase [Bacillus massiliigorillae]
MTTKQHVKEQFNENAPHYDNQRKRLIPCFHDFYSIPISIIETKNNAPTVLEIGAGTGLFASFLKEKYPQAHITAIDLSEKMLDVAKERFQNDKDIDYINADYTTHNFKGTFDIVISSLSIHHLTDEEKQKLYNKIYDLLNPNGIFINADQVLGQTAYIETLYTNDWKAKIEASGLTQQELTAAFERTKLDKMATLADQLNWLTESGFQDVDCIYKYFNFVVLFGRKI